MPVPTDTTRDPLLADAELRAVFDAAVEGIVVIDENGTILAFSAAAERLFGYCARDVIGSSVERLMPEPHRSHHAGYLRRYLETGEARVIGIGRRVDAVRSSGEIFPIGLSIGEVMSGNEHRFVGMIRDLSAEQATERRARSLETRLSHLGRFNIMGEMAAGIAHEINQPLTAIATYAQTAKRLLQRAPVPVEDLSGICDKIDAQAHRAGHVIRNIRRFIRQQDTGAEILDVNRVIADVWNLVEADARAEGIAVLARYGDGLPAIRADALQLQQVLLNLTRNSVDALGGGHHGRGTLVVATALAPDGRVCIIVTDNGPGVSSALGDDIFHPFVTTKPDGLGIGLAISRRIVQAHGGALSFSDNPQGGAVFTIHLDAAREDAGE